MAIDRLVVASNQERTSRALLREACILRIVVNFLVVRGALAVRIRGEQLKRTGVTVRREPH